MTLKDHNVLYSHIACLVTSLVAQGNSANLEVVRALDRMMRDTLTDIDPLWVSWGYFLTVTLNLRVKTLRTRKGKVIRIDLVPNS